MTFDIGEHVICSITIRDSDGSLQNPVTSMKIVVDRTNPSFLNVVSSVVMFNDSTGTYHYDCATSGYEAGTYTVTYTAIDSSRTTIKKDTFTLV